MLVLWWIVFRVNTDIADSWCSAWFRRIFGVEWFMRNHYYIDGASNWDGGKILSSIISKNNWNHWDEGCDVRCRGCRRMKLFWRSLGELWEGLQFCTSSRNSIYIQIRRKSSQISYISIFNNRINRTCCSESQSQRVFFFSNSHKQIECWMLKWSWNILELHLVIALI